MEHIYTPGGLTIKLHADRVERVLKPVRHLINIEDAFLDIQLWANFPGNMLSILAIITVLTTQSWTSVLIVVFLALSWLIFINIFLLTFSQGAISFCIRGVLRHTASLTDRRLYFISTGCYCSWNHSVCYGSYGHYRHCRFDFISFYAY